jgi:hypothetical protein
MKYLSEDVDDFYRLRILITFRSGRIVRQTFGPFTKESKAKEIRTRMSRVWNPKIMQPARIRSTRSPDTVVESIRYIIEIVPGFGWYPKSDDTYTAD